MLVLSHCDWPPTGYNDLSANEQPNLKKAPTLRGLKNILVSDNIANIRSFMMNDHPIYTLHPTLGTAFNLSASGDRHQVTSPANSTNSQLVYSPQTQLSSLSYKCSITLLGLYHLLVVLPAPNWQFPHGFSPWVLNLGTPWTHTSLQQPAINLNKPCLVHSAKLDEWDLQIVLWLPLAEPQTNDLKSSNGSFKDDNFYCVNKWHRFVTLH